MKTIKITTIIAIITVLFSGCSIAKVETANNTTLDSDDNITESKKEIEAFLRKYDSEIIKENKKEAIIEDVDNRMETIKGLPPRTSDLFASGLYMPYEDSNSIYHNFDQIYYKVESGKWDLSTTSNNSSRSAFIFTKEKGIK